MIRIIVTGGTIDKAYKPLAGELDYTATHIPDMFQRARLAHEPIVQELMLIDSLEMDDTHRQKIIEACRGSKEKQIIVTHGTDTMVESARAVQAVFDAGSMGKTIVFTGAMVPYSVSSPSSDALFNLGCAMAFVQALGPGVWIAMNGTYYKADRVKKDKQSGIFVVE